MPKYLLARLAGGQPDILEHTPTDHVRYTAMGGVLVTTAGVAGVSAAFALSTAVGLGPGAAIVAGGLWAVVILNLDRMLIVSMTRQSGWLRNALTVIPRIALAVVIGAIVSVPLVLHIFQPEIDFQLQKIHNTNLLDVQRGLDQAYSQIGNQQKQVDHLQLVASGQDRRSVKDDPDVSALQKERDAARVAAGAAEANAQCELVGSCGTHVPGRGEAYDRVRRRADLAKQYLATAQTKLDAATRAAQEHIDISTASDSAAAQQELTALRPKLQALRDDYARQQSRNIDAVSSNQGLLARLTALDQLSQDSPTQQAANRALFLLFMLIELLPVFVKLLSLMGPRTLYDRLLDKREQSQESNAYRVATELDHHRMDEQIRQGKDANTLLVQTQSKIAKKAIDVWGEIAMSRSDEELRLWYARHAGAPAGSPTTNATGAPPRPAPAAQPHPTAPAPAPAPTPAPAAATRGAQTYQQYRAAAGAGSTNGRQPARPPAHS